MEGHRTCVLPVCSLPLVQAAVSGWVETLLPADSSLNRSPPCYTNRKCCVTAVSLAAATERCNNVSCFRLRHSSTSYCSDTVLFSQQQAYNLTRNRHDAYRLGLNWDLWGGGFFVQWYGLVSIDHTVIWTISSVESRSNENCVLCRKRCCCWISQMSSKLNCI